MKTKAKVLHMIESPESLVREYVRVKTEIGELGLRLEKARVSLIEHLKTLPDCKGEIAGHLCSMHMTEKETFALDQARDVIGIRPLKPFVQTEIVETFDLKAAKEALDNRILRPYITRLEYPTLRVVPKLGAKR